jgi:type II secretory pathway pseudopilin PulG
MKTSTTSGFSLVEMLVYIALLVLVSSAAVSSLLAFSDAYVHYRTEKVLTRQLQEATERMVHDIQNSVAVNVVGSTLGVTPGTLMLDRAGSSVTYTLDSGVLTVQQDTDPAVPQTGSNVTVDSLQFEYLTNVHTEMVQVSITATATLGDYSATETYQTSAIIRGSYE